jgi:ribosome biogenesis GTPase
MAPKYRGNSDDWLDNESKFRGKASAKPKKKPKARSVDLPLEEANATVVEVFPNQCRIKMDSNGTEFLCSYRRAEVIGKSQEKNEGKERSPVAVGDRVQVQETGQLQGVIEGICRRRNCIARPAPGRESGKHVLAANIDMIMIVVSAREPMFSPGLVDRFLVAATAEGIATSICVTKIDLMVSQEKEWSIYEQLGYPVFEISSKSKMGMDGIAKEIQGKSVVFCGQSGVGKTSLLRVLLNNENYGRINEVNLHTGKGRHTTTSAILLEGPSSSSWIDTPGVREFSVGDIPPGSLAHYFPEMKGLGCSQQGCFHLDEAECRARQLPRYLSYRRILESILNPES